MSTKARNEEEGQADVGARAATPAEAGAGVDAARPDDGTAETSPDGEAGDKAAQPDDGTPETAANGDAGDEAAQPDDGTLETSVDADAGDEAAQPDDGTPETSVDGEAETGVDAETDADAGDRGEAEPAAAAEVPVASPATATGSATYPPPNAFLKGAVLGLILFIPLTALAVYLLGRLEIGDPESSYYTIIAFVAVFAGLPAILTAGGIGRAAASALVRPGDRGGPSASTRVATIYTAMTSVGFVLLTVVPMGEVPTEVGTWVWIIVLGGSTGALGGFVLGLWVGYGSREP